MKTSFSRRIPTELKPDDLWRFVASSLRNSDAQRLWPSALETSRAESLRVGSVIHVTYHAWILDKPVRYRVAELNPDQYRLSYHATKDHPLKGGATIQVQASARGSDLLWKGAYEHPWYSAAGFFLRYYFLERFFDQLELGLRSLEERAKRKRAA
ncbi:MAG: SRPBCC family protein [Bacteriovoracia bacterium]